MPTARSPVSEMVQTLWAEHERVGLLDSRVLMDVRTFCNADIYCREKVGGDINVWNDFVSLFQAAIPSLENRSFAAPDNTSVDQVSDYLGPSGEHIAKNSASLLEDLDRLDLIVSLGKNVLVNGESTQNLVLETLFHRQIFKLIGVCVRITARGYDGEAGTVQEQKWQKVINACMYSQCWKMGRYRLLESVPLT